MRRGRGSEAEENAKKNWRITSEDQIYLVVGGKVVSWEEVTKMEEGMTVEVTCAMRGGGRKKRKERNPWNSSEESSTGGMSTQDEGDEGEAEDLWTKVIRKQLQDWSKKSSENETMRRFVEQAAHMGPGLRDEAIRGYIEALHGIPRRRIERSGSVVDQVEGGRKVGRRREGEIGRVDQAER